MNSPALYLLLALVIPGWLCPAFAQEGNSSLDQRTLYLGGGFGSSSVDPDGDQRQVEGIDFSFNSDDDDLGSRFFLGYWITPHVGVEAGYHNLGKVDVGFDFSDPRNGRTGTGESEIDIRGSVYDLMLGTVFAEHFRVVGKVGAFVWTEDFTSRFDVPGEPSRSRSFEEDGTGLHYGAGLRYNFRRGWSLFADADFFDVDGDEVQLISGGLMYEFDVLGVFQNMDQGF